VTKENYEEFVKKHKVIYDIYFRQIDKKNEIVQELTNIFKERGELLSNIGVQLLVENDMDVLANQMENFTFYVPNDKNTKTINEMMDFIFSEDTIEKIKKDEKISEKDISLQPIEF
jgi:predicted DNA-binding protein